VATSLPTEKVNPLALIDEKGYSASKNRMAERPTSATHRPGSNRHKVLPPIAAQWCTITDKIIIYFIVFFIFCQQLKTHLLTKDSTKHQKTKVVLATNSWYTFADKGFHWLHGNNNWVWWEPLPEWKKSTPITPYCMLKPKRYLLPTAVMQHIFILDRATKTIALQFQARQTAIVLPIFMLFFFFCLVSFELHDRFD
jgi:hypothetical protein